MLFLLACTIGGGQDTFLFRDTGSLLCGTFPLSTEPKEGAADVWWDQRLQLVYDVTVHDASVETVVDGTVEASGGEIAFTPSEPWPPGRTIDVLVSACEDAMKFSFSTIGASGPVAPDALDGQAWTLGDAGVGPFTVLHALYGLTPPTVLLRGDEVVLDGGGDTCDSYTGALPVLWANDSALWVQTPTLMFSADGAPVTMDVDSFFLDFSADKLAPAGVGLRGELRLDELGAALGKSAYAMCEDIEAFDVACGTCDTGVCVHFDISALVGTPADPAPVESARNTCG